MNRGRVVLEAWEERVLAEREAVVVTHRCCWCKWKRHGTVAETRALYLEHRADKHPDRVPVVRKKRHRPYRQFSSAHSLDDNIANARSQGAAGWAGPE